LVVYISINGERKLIEAFLFDLDGTLVRTEAKYREMVVKNALEHLGKPFRKEYVNKLWFNKNKAKFLERELGLDFAKFWNAFNKFDKPEERSAATYPYIDGFLVPPILHELGLPLGIVTACPRTKVDAYKDRFRRKYFDSLVIQNSLEGMPSKPDPAGILKCCEELCVSPRDIAYVGDEERDAEAARNSGALDIIVDRSGTKRYQATLKITSLFSLLDKL
jgi:phosphoglycolate phosphatase